MFSSHWNLLIITILTQRLDSRPTANLSTTWINSPSAIHSVEYWDSTTIRAILLNDGPTPDGPKFACGFYCDGDCQTYLFAVFYVQTDDNGGLDSLATPVVVWSANRNNPVEINATLQLTAEGDLVLRDVHGTLAWSTNSTSGMSVAGLNLTTMGNLVLFDEKNDVVWQSFDHPTDVLVPGQRLVVGQSLTARVSSTNWSEGGLYSLSMTHNGLMAYIHSDPDRPQVYYTPANLARRENTTNEETISYAVFGNGTLRIHSGPDTADCQNQH